MDLIKLLLSLLIVSLAPPVISADYLSLKMGTRYISHSQGTKESVMTVISTETDGYGVQINRGGESVGRHTRLFGILHLSPEQGLLPADIVKARKLFPLEVGKRVRFDVYGGHEPQKWFRENNWEVVSKYTQVIGSRTDEIFVLRLQSEAPRFYKADLKCDYAPRLAICLRLVGEQFVARNPQASGPVSVEVKTIVIDGAEINIPKLP